jgi:hypothetical protein
MKGDKAIVETRILVESVWFMALIAKEPNKVNRVIAKTYPQYSL